MTPDYRGHWLWICARCYRKFFGLLQWRKHVRSAHDQQVRRYV